MISSSHWTRIRVLELDEPAYCCCYCAAL